MTRHYAHQNIINSNSIKLSKIGDSREDFSDTACSDENTRSKEKLNYHEGHR